MDYVCVIIIDAMHTVMELRESCCTAVEILNELLMYEKIEANAMRLDKTSTYSVPFVVKACTPFLLQSQQKGIDYRILRKELNLGTSEIRNWILLVDQNKLTQVIRNFISNAIKFTPSGGRIDVRAEIVHSRVRPSLRVEVRDSGFGIAPENQHRVFNEVVQFNAAQQQGGGGSGFGLIISRKIVELHDGRIGLKSEGDGRGCTFFLEVPVEEGAPDTSDYNILKLQTLPSTTALDLSRRIASTSPRPQKTGIKLRILVVDDSNINRRMTRRMLERLGHVCEEASDGDVAVSMFKLSLETGILYDMILMVPDLFSCR
jgi:CheY-like chemotaxis protein